MCGFAFSSVGKTYIPLTGDDLYWYDAAKSANHLGNKSKNLKTDPKTIPV